MLGRNKDQKRTGSSVIPQVPEPEHAPRPGAKNRPTPKRKEAQAARKRPLVVADRKEAARQERERYRQGLASGEQKYLAERDKGPVRSFQRDLVDSRWCIGEFLLPLMLVAMVVYFVNNGPYWALLILFVYLVLFLAIVDSLLLVRRARRMVREKFGEEPPKGSGFYIFTRTFQWRAWRVPKPRVPRGFKPS